MVIYGVTLVLCVQFSSRRAGQPGGYGMACRAQGVSWRFLRSPASRVAFSGLRALADVSFDVAERDRRVDWTTRGKSTLLNACRRLYRPQAGQIVSQAADLLDRKIHEVAAMGIRRSFPELETVSRGQRA